MCWKYRANSSFTTSASSEEQFGVMTSFMLRLTFGRSTLLLFLLTQCSEHVTQDSLRVRHISAPCRSAQRRGDSRMPAQNTRPCDRPKDRLVRSAWHG